MPNFLTVPNLVIGGQEMAEILRGGGIFPPSHVCRIFYHMRNRVKAILLSL